MQRLGTSKTSGQASAPGRSSLAQRQVAQQRPVCRRCAVRAMAETAKRPQRPTQQSEDGPARPSAPTTPGAAAQSLNISSVSIDYQRQQAKAMQKFFRERDFQVQQDKSQFFGWTKANEITNGRWVMFGFAVGLLTEYATGVDFPHQFGLMSSYLGILDFD